MTEVETERFRTRGKVTLQAGWRGIYGVEPDEPRTQDEEGEAEGELPRLEEEGGIRRLAEALVADRESFVVEHAAALERLHQPRKKRAVPAGFGPSR